MIWQSFILLGLLHCACAVSNSERDNIPMEAKIWKAIAGNDPEARKFIPGTPNNPVNATFSLSLVSLSDYEPIQSSIRIGYWMTLQWKVPKYSWDPKKFGGVKTIRIPLNEIWTPDVLSFKHLGSQPEIEVQVVLSSDGSFMFVPYISTTALCTGVPHGPRFPRDEVNCQLTFGSWTYDGFVLNVTTEKQDKASLTPYLNYYTLLSSGWKFQNATTFYQVLKYPCCKEPYPQIVLTVTIQRNDIYFYMAVSVPGAVTGLLVAVLHFLNPKSPARIVSQTLCLVIFVYLAISDMHMMQSSAEIGQSGFYVIGAMVLTLLAIIWSVAASIIWTHVSSNNAILNSFLDKLECICLLPSNRKHFDDQTTDLVNSGEKSAHKAILTAVQRLCLVLDRIFSIITLIIFLVLFHKLAA